jgi:lipopolysaccharide biosynthesis regulator YciM
MTVLIIIVIALIALVLYLYFNRRRERVTRHTPYIEALIALLEHQDSVAMKKLKEAVSVDSDLVDAYIRLGDLYREKGDVSRALQIHQSLTVRPTLKKHEEKRVYYALVKDMLASNRPNKAVSFLKEILKIDKKDSQAQEMILRMYEDMGNFSDCITMYEDMKRRARSEQRLAFYYAAAAHTKLKNPDEEDETEQEKEAVGMLRKALRTAPESFTALYYMAKYFEQKGDLKKAREYYNKIMTTHPDHAFAIIPEFEKVYFELDLYDKIEPIYEKIFGKNPRNFAVGLALAKVYEKKDDAQRSHEIYSRLSDLFPHSMLTKLHMLKTMVDDESTKERIEEMEERISHMQYRCANCKFETEKYNLLCPRCHAIESFLPYL